jgi:hypothetical protein
MKTIAIVLSAFALGMGAATPTQVVVTDKMRLALQCIYTRNDVLGAGTLLCHYDCGGHDITTIVKSPNSCPLSIDV